MIDLSLLLSATKSSNVNADLALFKIRLDGLDCLIYRLPGRDHHQDAARLIQYMAKLVKLIEYFDCLSVKMGLSNFRFKSKPATEYPFRSKFKAKLRPISLRPRIPMFNLFLLVFQYFLRNVIQ
jgi:hypothetical protein